MTDQIQKPYRAIETGNMNLEIKPGDDFFRYVNDNWIKNHPIPDEYSTYGAFTELTENNEIQLRDIINEIACDTNAPQGSINQKIRDLYNTGMNIEAINNNASKELKPLIDSISTVTDKKQLARLIAEMHLSYSSPLFSCGADADARDTETVAFYLNQGGLGLPDREDYFGTDEHGKEMLSKYQEHIEKMFMLAHFSSLEANTAAEKVLEIETFLASNSLTRVERRDPIKTYNKLNINQLIKLSPDFDWKLYFTTLGLGHLNEVIIESPHFFETLSTLVHQFELENIKIYLTWRLLSSLSNCLGTDFEDEHFSFYGSYLYGQVSMKPRWKRIQNICSELLGEAIGQQYVKKYFPPESKAKMISLVENLRTALGQRIERLTWMSETTKQKALIKLAAMDMKIGYPDKWKDYEGLNIDTQSYLQNRINLSHFLSARELAKVGKPVDKTEWFMTPQTVNAYFNPTRNEIVFPAGILQAPFFDARADDAINYGGIGVVIGHEMTHAFDDQGRLFDEKGNLNEWWTAEDAQHFKERTQQMVKLFNEFVLLHTLHINGELTLGENIADLGGLNIAKDALEHATAHTIYPTIDGFSKDQRFFISYGQVWRNNIRDKALERRIKEDVHSPAEARVNRALFSVDSFYEAFGITENDRLFIKPEERANIW